MSKPSFESDLPEALDRSLSSFPEVNSLKAEQRLVIEKVFTEEMFSLSYWTLCGVSATQNIVFLQRCLQSQHLKILFRATNKK